MKLYELTESYLNLQELLENPEVPQALITSALEQVGEELEIKAENIAKLIKTLEVDITGFKEEEKRLSDRRKSLENRVKNLKEYLDGAMKATGKTNFKGKLFSFNIQPNSPGVEVLDEKLIPKKYFVNQAPVLDKKTILKDSKNGEDIPGVKIIQTESLRIR
ncbi:siphovirus Gp157 family protein [Clostridium saudiense]|uniref:siphovirus Gp157 family protein n=1 Tax=Clostridium saudiense TaxID=1414720 RepID=UPI00266F2F00|nr:siphovirus Gp157 family protein [Clostridium saudiense]